LLGLLLYPADGGNIFIRNRCLLLSNYMASIPEDINLSNENVPGDFTLCIFTAREPLLRW
jgi:hypothetical protein